MLMKKEDSSPADGQGFEHAHPVAEPSIGDWNARPFAELSFNSVQARTPLTRPPQP